MIVTLFQKTANKIWEIVDHKVKEFKGGYEEYVAWKERMAKQEADAKKAQGTRSKEQGGSQRSEVRSLKSDESKKSNESKKSDESNTSAPSSQSEKLSGKPQASTPINKEAKKELHKQQRIFQQLEEQIAQLNKRKAELESSLTELFDSVR